MQCVELKQFGMLLIIERPFYFEMYSIIAYRSSWFEVKL